MSVIVIADTEGTGLGDDARVCEYAHIVCALQNNGAHDVLVVVEEVETLFNPGVPIPPETTKIHGITDAMVVGAPFIEDTLPGLFPKSLDLEIYGHNFTRFDMKFLHKYVPQQAEIGCSLRAARRWILDSKKHGLDHLRGHLQLPDVRAHSAAGDVHTTKDVINHILSMGVPWADVQAEMLARINIMPWGKHKGTPLDQLDDEYVRWLLEEAEATSWELRRALQEL